MDRVSTLADEITALRTWITTNCLGVPLQAVFGTLDRISAMAPVPAHGTSGLGVWQHACGSVKALDDAPIDGIHEHPCSWCYKPGTWRALYVMPDGE
jgi:hypothetical protein